MAVKGAFAYESNWRTVVDASRHLGRGGRAPLSRGSSSPPLRPLCLPLHLLKRGEEKNEKKYFSHLHVGPAYYFIFILLTRLPRQ